MAQAPWGGDGPPGPLPRPAAAALYPRSPPVHSRAREAGMAMGPFCGGESWLRGDSVGRVSRVTQSQAGSSELLAPAPTSAISHGPHRGSWPPSSAPLTGSLRLRPRLPVLPAMSVSAPGPPGFHPDSWEQSPPISLKQPCVSAPAGRAGLAGLTVAARELPSCPCLCRPGHLGCWWQREAAAALATGTGLGAPRWGSPYPGGTPAAGTS